MCCAIGILGILGPRALIVFWWLVDPARWALTFNNAVLLPALGFVFLPWTTIMYVLFWTSTGVPFLGWIFVLLGLVFDIGTYGGGAFGNKDQIQSYYKES
jgi:hypothetical protein